MPTLRFFRLFVTTAVVCIAVTALHSPALAQSAGGTSPVYRLKPGDDNHLGVYKRFTSIIEHTANIKSVLDFDSEVIRIEVVQGNPQQVRVFALEPGVTTVTIQDEFDQYYKVEVLVKGDVRHLQSYIRRLYPDDDVHVEEVKGAVLLTGWVTEPSNINEIVSLAEQFYPEVMNHMSIGGAQQVLLRCRILEVNRSKIRTFGMNFSFLRNNGYLISTPGPITPIQTLTASPAGPSATLTGFGDATLSFGLIGNGGIFEGFVQALREEGLLKIHSNPMVVAHNGQPANLLNGGETPVIVPGGLGTNAIEYKEFGVQMTAVPHILGNGRVRLQVQPEVSERDFSSAVTVGGITIPAFTVRRASTEVEMNMGETLVIAGLISNREDASTSKVPLLGELPWIGAAFSRKRYTESESELIILVTPDYTAPLSDEQIPHGGPGLFTDTPVDRELYFHGLLEIPRTGDPCFFQTSCVGCDECRNGGNCGRNGGAGCRGSYGNGSCSNGSCGNGSCSNGSCSNGSCGAGGCTDGSCGAGGCSNGSCGVGYPTGSLIGPGAKAPPGTVNPGTGSVYSGLTGTGQGSVNAPPIAQPPITQPPADKPRAGMGIPGFRR